MNNQYIIQLKIDALNKRLMNYQKASVDAIMDLYKRKNRVLLADEVGLGKTEITKGVIAQLAQAHHTSNPKRPLRVAYICSNQNVAKQNFPKLAIFPQGIVRNDDIVTDLTTALGDYLTAIKGNRQNPKSSVYTRVCEWLIGLYSGQLFEDVVDDDVKGIYLGAEDVITRASTESSINKGNAKYIQKAAEELLKAVTRIVGAGILPPFPQPKEPLQKRFYSYNKLVAARLSNRINQDYRLSMQHLYTVESKAFGSGDIMQLECLTPSTSLKIGTGKGTVEERALLKATIKYCGGTWAYTENRDNYERLVAEFEARLKACKYRVNPVFKLSESDISKIRTSFIEENLKDLSYDLIILDEFQNFSQLLTDDTEYGKLAKSLFEKDNTKMLLLSATPIQSTERWSDTTSQEAVECSLRSIKAFLGNEDATDLYQLGVFRTQRMAASSHSPILEEYNPISMDFSDVLLAQKLSHELDMKNFHPRYVTATPYAFSFTDGYKLWKEEGVSIEGAYNSPNFKTSTDYSSLFVGGNTGNTAYQKLEEDLFKDNGQYLLWIPPANPSHALAGVFEGKEGFSKTLIFANFSMTPKAFTYLFCQKAQQNVCVTGTENPDTMRASDFKDMRASYFEGIAKWEKTKQALQEGFYKLFSSPIGQHCVGKNQSTDDYKADVAQYCQDGCFTDMIEEYVALLSGEYGDNDARMAYAVKTAFGYQPDTILVTKQNGKTLVVEEHNLPNHYAVGLYRNELKKASPDGTLAKIKPAFNSPFWPFVFTTTSIGTEGIDLHWYARNVVHWSLPRRAIDLEQRNGRVLRYLCHGVRLNNGLIEKTTPAISASMNAGWENSGLYQTQLNFFSEEEKGTDPNGCYHVRSYFYYNKFGADYENKKTAETFIKSYQEALKDLAPYSLQQPHITHYEANAPQAP